MADVFISYAREDSSRARQLAEILESRGWSVSWDRRIPPGIEVRSYVERQLNEARCVIVLWSGAAVASPFVRDEATWALDSHKLVPVRITDTRIPLGFRQLQTADLFDWSGQWNEQLENLLGTVGEFMGRLETTAAGARLEAAPHAAAPTSRLGMPVVATFGVVAAGLALATWLVLLNLRRAPSLPALPVAAGTGAIWRPILGWGIIVVAMAFTLFVVRQAIEFAAAVRLIKRLRRN